MIVGLEEISAGEIMVGDRVVNQLAPEERNVSLAFENYALYPNLSVYDNLAFPLRAHGGYSQREIESKITKIAERFRLQDTLHEKPAALSGGQQQAVSLGRALVKDSDLYLLDEPLSHLDLRYRAYVAAEIKNLHFLNKLTMVLITHDQAEALEMADRIAVMNFGVLQQVGTPEEIFNHPANRFVADFVGEPPMNFIDCQLVNEHGQLSLSAQGHILPVPKELASVGADLDKDEDELVLGIRPRDIEVGRSNSNGYTIEAPTYTYELLGEHALLTTKFGEQLVQATTDVLHRPKVGEVVPLTLDSERIHLFSKGTGRALC